MDNKKEYQKEYYKKHKEHIKAYNKLHYHLVYKEQKKIKEEAYYIKNPEKAMLKSSKQRAKENGLEFNIQETDIKIPTHCPILGIELDMNRKKGKRFNGPSLDRIDSSKGYVKGNIWIISDLANRMKQNATVEQLKLFGEWTKTL
jgi:hypothetical protein